MRPRSRPKTWGPAIALALLAVAAVIWMLRPRGPSAYTVPQSIETLAKEYVRYPVGSRQEWYERSGFLRGELAASGRRRTDGAEFLEHLESGQGGEFPNAIARELFGYALENGDRGMLARVLAAYPLEVDGPDGFYVEFALVSPYRDGTIDNFRVLFDAIRLAKKPEPRQALVGSLRRAFYTQLTPDMTDEQVIEFAQREFERGHQGWKTNLFWRQAYSPGFFDITNADPPPLFIPKDGPDEVKYNLRGP